MKSSCFCKATFVIILDSKDIGEAKMVVLAIPINKPFEVAGDKVELFDKKVKESKGKQILLDRLKKHSKDDIGWK